MQKKGKQIYLDERKIESKKKKKRSRMEGERKGWGTQIHCPDGTGLLVVSAYKHCNDLMIS